MNTNWIGVICMNKHYWLLRPLPHGTDHLEDFLKNDFIAVGYPVGKNLSDFSFNDMRTILSKNDMEEGIGNLHSLVKGMNIGDVIVVPSTNKKDIYFAEVESDYIYDETVDKNVEGLGYPHQREVKWLLNKKSILRSDLPNELRGSLRYPGAVADLTKHAQLIEQLINGTITEVTALETDAIDVIKELLNSEDDSIRLKAAELVLKFKL